MKARRLVPALAVLLLALLSACAGVPGTQLTALPVPGTGRPDVVALKVDGATDAIVVLHGGGGNAQGMPHQVALSSTPEPDAGSIAWDWLKEHRTSVVFAQGGLGDEGRYVWNNGLRTSQVDDAGYLAALADELRRAWGVRRVVLAGHSAGGIMAHYVWCTHPDAYDAYVAWAGPPAAGLTAPGACAATQDSPPVLSIVGSADEAIIAGAPWDAPVWQQYGRPSADGNARTSLSDPAALAWRANVLCGSDATTQASAGRTTTWEACGGEATLVRVEGAQHALDTIAEGLDADDPQALMEVTWRFRRP